MAGVPDAARERALARVGTSLGSKWRLDALLAIGGAAAVYRGTHRNGLKGAVKVLHAELARDRDFVQRFLREGYAANQVGHPGAVKVLDDNATPDGVQYLVMELLEGESLERLLARTGPLDESFVLWVAGEVLPVLAAAHGKGIIHRDIKPENLFYTSARDVRVLDFGVARMKDPAYGIAATTSRHVMGTPAYMAPEQARGRWEQVDATSDLWALGATMYALLTGRLLREAKTRTEELMLAMTVPVPSLAQLVPGLSPDVVAIVDRALSFDRTRRFPSARAMHEAVREALLARGLRGPVAPVHAYRHATAPASGSVSALHFLPASLGAESIEPVSSSPLLEECDRTSRDLTTALTSPRRSQMRLLGVVALSAGVAAIIGACLATRPWTARRSAQSDTLPEPPAAPAELPRLAPPVAALETSAKPTVPAATALPQGSPESGTPPPAVGSATPALASAPTAPPPAKPPRPRPRPTRHTRHP